MAIGEAIARSGIRKHYYLETRGDVLLRNKEAFRLWKRLGLNTCSSASRRSMRRGCGSSASGSRSAAISRLSNSPARSAINVAINLIADPDWDHERFNSVRDWGLEMPEVINISVNTPYPGPRAGSPTGGGWRRRDYRLFDIQHAVLPTRLPLAEFYRELVTTQRAIYSRHLDWRQLWDASGIVARLLLRGQTNFVRSLFSLNRVYRPELLLADHDAPVDYEIPLPPRADEAAHPAASSLYIHPARGRKARAIDTATERFVEETRIGTSA